MNRREILATSAAAALIPPTNREASAKRAHIYRRHSWRSASPLRLPCTSSYLEIQPTFEANRG